MNTFQKVIKYVAIGFAVLLTIGIISGIVGLVGSIVTGASRRERDVIDFSSDFTGVENLDISSGYGKLVVKRGDKFRVEATSVSDSFKAEVKNNTLVIDDTDFINNFLWFDFGTKFYKKASITVYVPDGFDAGRIDIDNGAGDVRLDNIITDILIIDAGVGDITGENIQARKVDANGGVGDITFTDIDFSDVDFDSGVGDIEIEGIIKGESEFDCGVGDLDIIIKGSREDYALDVDSGIGSIRVNGSKVSSEYNDNYKADHTISISGGIGDVEIDFIY